MTRFNKYHFIEDLKLAIGEFIKDSNFEPDEYISDKVYDFIHEYLENEIIYYHNCWEICMQEGATDFAIEQTKTKATNISELAYWTLWDIVNDSINTHLDSEDFLKDIKDKQTTKTYFNYGGIR